jgi:hypothetical protein
VAGFSVAKLMAAAFGGWQVSAIWSINSGRPFSIVGGNGNDNSLSQQFNDRADLTGHPYNVRQGTQTQWLAQYFNKAAFKTNAPGTLGSSARNLLYGPGVDTADAGIYRNWQIRERYGVRFDGRCSML